MLGDSWGVGEWIVKNGLHESIPNTGLDHYLTQLGHTVTNISAGSASNFGQLRHTYWTLKENSDYDYIIWFHTESMRDIEEILINDSDEGQRYFPDFDISNFESGLDYLDFENYKYAQAITDAYNIPFIVIGGQCLINPVIDQFSFAKYKIDSWLAELLKLQFRPPKNTFFSWDKIKRILAHYEINEKEFIINNIDQLDKAKVIQDLAKGSPLFPDDAHPSRDCFKKLATQLHNKLAKNETCS
jgi:hypothetical protein